MTGFSRHLKLIVVLMIFSVISAGFFWIKQILVLSANGFILETDPSNNAKDVHLYRYIIIRTAREVWHAVVNIPGVKGEIFINGREIKFKPKRCFKPNTIYYIRFRADAFEGNKIYLYSFSFTTMDIGNKIWVEVDLSNYHTVTVYRGATPIRIMLASGGRPGRDTETILGTFYIKDRGREFYSERFEEGALYWVRITKQYLFHSIPRDREGNIKEEELKKLGLPASHGCIRFADEDARWFYENVPDGTMVIIHD